MILKEMMLENLQGMALPMKGGTPVSAQEKAGGVKSVFGDVLSSTVRARENGGNSVKRNGNDTAGDGKAIKTFREIKNKISHEAEKPAANAKTEASDDLEDGKKKAAGRKVNRGTAESLTNCIAQLLGMNPAEFMKLLQAANITPEELVNATDVRQLTDRLAAVLGLNGEQSGVLNDLLEMIKTQLQIQVQEPGSGTAGETAAANGAENRKDTAGVAEETGGSPRIEIIKMPEDTQSGLAELIAGLKLKLGELKGKLENGKEGVAEEISQRLGAILKDMGGSKAGNTEIQPTDGQETAETVKTGDPAAAAGAGLNEAGNNTGKDSAGSRESKSESRAEKADTAAARPAAEAAAPVAGDNGNPLAATAAGAVQKAGEIASADRPNERIPVQAKEIINQVVEKAKVILTGDKSEMVMDLKPDSLGKLSLKVVTENGIVTARFVAENQQVRQVLESNMQLLKDALEKQGMNVQGFSVSVRQDSPQGSGRQDGTGSSGRLSHRRPAFRTEGLTAAMDTIAAMERHNPYKLSTSTVEFSA